MEPPLSLVAILTHPVLLQWLGGMVGGQLVLSWLCARSRSPFAKAPAFAAHQLCVVVPFTWLAISGCRLWFGKHEEGGASSLTDRFYGHSPAGQYNLLVVAALMLYDLAATLAIPELHSDRVKFVQMLGHHVSTGYLAFLALNGNFLVYYTIFFVGVAEISSAPLALFDLFKAFPLTRGSLPLAYDAIKGAFVFSFLPVRCVYWPIVSAAFWCDSLEVLSAHLSGGVENFNSALHSPQALAQAQAQAQEEEELHLHLHSASALAAFLIFNIGLTLLQWFWGSKCVGALYRFFADGEKGD